MRALLIIATAGLLLVTLPIGYAFMLPLCGLLALISTFVRRCPEFAAHDGKSVLTVKSRDHVRYRIPRTKAFVVLPREWF